MLGVLAGLVGVNIAVGAYVRCGTWFGGEDPFADEGTGGWHHEEITQEAAVAAGWAPQAADELAWHADFLDSYLYNPLWWVKGGVDRLKVSLSTRDMMKNLHFDDLSSVEQIDRMWTRYTSGALAGLVWAAQLDGRREVSAGRNVVGVALHAIQDFYSHTNWIDDPARRDKTWLGHNAADRLEIALYSGAYESPVEATTIAHHGAISYACSVLQHLPDWMRDIVIHSASPLAHTSLGRQWKACKEGVTAQPPSVRGVRLPPGVLVMAPPGINLDSSWQAPMGVAQRKGLRELRDDIAPRDAFLAARRLAVLESTAWLKRFAGHVERAGLAEYWKRVTTEPRRSSSARAQYESFDRFPYMFLAAGDYPPRAGDEDKWYLRLRIKTADDEPGTGTDADIYCDAAGQSQLLDYLPREIPGLAHDDFMAGDDESYLVGPLPTFPSRIVLRNDAPDLGDFFEELGRSFVAAVTDTWYAIGDVLLSLIGGHADLVDAGTETWSPAELAAIQRGRTSTRKVRLDGGSEGVWEVEVALQRGPSTWRHGRLWNRFSVRLTTLTCIREADTDRGTDSDEPFVLAVLVNQAAESVDQWRSPVFESGVDAGDPPIPLDMRFRVVLVPEGIGYLTLAIAVMESDAETRHMRQRALEEMAQRLERDTEAPRRGLLDIVGGGLGPDWKVAHVEAVAFKRGPRVEVGKVLDQRLDRWIPGGSSVELKLDPAKVRGFSADMSKSNLDEDLGVRIPQVVVLDVRGSLVDPFL